ncbi:MAG: hypothetical protein AAFY02_05120 [Pseudomonadota bacterium]
MVILRYPRKSLIGDWIRTACGLGIGAGMLLFTPLTWWTGLIFGPITLLFAYFGRRTVERQFQEVAMNDQGLWVRDLRQRGLQWQSLTALRLRFYGSRRQHRKLKAGEEESGGFLELTVTAGATRLRFDSSLEGFSLLAWRAAEAARSEGLTLDPATAGNLLDIGIDPDQDSAPPEMAGAWHAALAEQAGR